MQTTPPAHPTPPAAQPGAPWPTFRHDHRNTGLSTLPARYAGDQPWTFPTGKGIFSTPVIDREGAIYVGSADHYFYALRPDGALRWKFKTGEIIDSAAALPAHQPQGKPTVVVPSADGHLYCLDTASGQPLWSYDGNEDLVEHFNNWFEGNVALGPDGSLYAGNTNFNYYALTPGGDLKWIYRTGSNAWSIAGFTPEGTIVWGSCDTFIHGVSLHGERRWRKRTLGFVAASAAVSREGPVYIGSFDSRLYALDPTSGKTLWAFRTGDHIYSSAALLEVDGRTRLILFGSTDGALYALTPEGELAWSYDTGAPIRSSPVIGRAPGKASGWVVYFGSGTGKLYALNAETGRRRWSYDTTPEDPAAAVRNDLNGSPALSPTGIIIGGEHGRICYVPYDYPLHHDDPRASLDPGEDLPEQAQALYFVSPGGGLNLEPPAEIPPSTVLSFRLLDRENGQTRSGRLTNAPLGTWRRKLEVKTEPELPVRWEVSPDGKHLHLIPEGFLDPGSTVRIHIQGAVYRGGLRIGNLKLGGRKHGSFSDHFQFRVREDRVETFPLLPDRGDNPGLEWTRLAVPLPTMLPSLNQIGFDYLSWLIGPAAAEPPDQDGCGRLVCWAVGARRDQANQLQVDPTSDFIFPLAGQYRGSAYRLSNANFTMKITGIPIPFREFQLRGSLQPDLSAPAPSSVLAATGVLGIPNFGPAMVVAGLANRVWRELIAVGTYLTRPAPERRTGNPAVQRASVERFSFTPPGRSQPGEVSASFQIPGDTLPAEKHRAGVLLLDPNGLQPVSLDYQAALSQSADQDGSLTGVLLQIPPGTQLPDPVRIIVLIDVQPVRDLTLPSRERHRS